MVNARLAIVGSIDVSLPQIDNALWIVECILRSESPSLVISGGANGIDDVAKNVAERAGIPTKIYYPLNTSWDKGYKARNIQIAEACDELVSIRSINSSTYGSGWTADHAQALGKVVRRLYV